MISVACQITNVEGPFSDEEVGKSVYYVSFRVVSPSSDVFDQLGKAMIQLTYANMRFPINGYILTPRIDVVHAGKFGPQLQLTTPLEILEYGSKAPQLKKSLTRRLSLVPSS